MKLIRFLILLQLPAVLLLSCGPQEEKEDYEEKDEYEEKIDYGPLEEYIENTANRSIEENDIKGISAGFTDYCNDYRFEKGYGNTSDSSLFPMASVTKVVTSAAVMQIIQEGKLELDDKLSDHLPEFKLEKPYPDSPEITIRHIMTHTAGLTRDIMSKAQGYCPVETEEILDYLNNHMQIAPAVYRHHYSNPGFELLALVIENISGRSYQSYMRENILDSLGMGNSFFAEGNEGVETGFYTTLSDIGYNEMPVNYMAAGGLKSNVPDMLNFAEMLLQPSVNEDDGMLKEPYLEMMFSRQNADVLLDHDVNIGASVFLEELPDPFSGKLVYHGGGAVFSNAVFIIAPDYGIGTVVFCNTAGSYELLMEMGRDIISKALEIKTGDEYKAQPRYIPREDSLSFQEQRKITGNYYTHSDIIRIKEHKEYEDSIVALTGADTLSVNFFEDGYFSFREGFYFKTDSIGEEKILFSLRDRALSPFGRHREIEEYSVPESWEEAKGSYYVVDPCEKGSFLHYERLTVSVRDNKLFLGMLPEKIIRDIYGITSEMNILLEPVDEDTAIMQGFGRYFSEPVFLDTENGTIEFSGLTFARPEPE